MVSDRETPGCAPNVPSQRPGWNQMLWEIPQCCVAKVLRFNVHTVAGRAQSDADFNSVGLSQVW